jgi:hypothetical protein
VLTRQVIKTYEGVDVEFTSGLNVGRSVVALPPGEERQVANGIEARLTQI